MNLNWRRWAAVGSFTERSWTMPKRRRELSTRLKAVSSDSGRLWEEEEEGEEEEEVSEEARVPSRVRRTLTMTMALEKI